MPHSWYNMRSNNAWFTIVTKAGDNYDIDKCKIKADYYDRPERVIAAVNKTSKEASGGKTVTVSYSKISQKMTVDLDPGILWICRICLHLIKNYTSSEANSVVDMAQGFYSFSGTLCLC